MQAQANPFADLTGYERRHLVSHMEAAGRVAELHRLLRLETQGGQNAWYETKRSSGDTAAFSLDVALAWRLAREAMARAVDDAALDALPGGEALALQIRYALITASVNSLAQNLPPALLAAAVAGGEWAPSLALAHASQVPDSTQRGEALAALAPHLPPAMVGEAARLAQELGNLEDRATALAGLAPYLPEPLQGEALAAIDRLPDSKERSGRRAAVARGLAATGQGHLAVRVTESIEDPQVRAEVLAGLAPNLPVAVLPEALEAVKGLRSSFDQGTALAGLAPWLPTELLAEAAVVAQGMRSDRARIGTYASLAPHCGDAQRRDLVDAALAALPNVRNVRDRAALFGPLAPSLSAGQAQAAIAAAQAIRNVEARSVALAGLAPHLSRSLRDGTLARVPKLKGPSTQAEVLQRLAPYLPKRGQRRALSLARKIETRTVRAPVVAALVQHLPADEAEKATQAAVRAAQELSKAETRAQVLVEIVPLLPESGQREAMVTVTRMQDPGAKAAAIAGLAPYLVEELVPEAVAAAWKVRDHEARAVALAGLAPYLRQPLLRETLYRLLQIDDLAEQAMILAAYARHLGDPMLAYAQAVTLQVEDEQARARILQALVPHLPCAGLHAVLANVGAMGDEHSRALGLAALAPYVPEEMHEEMLEAARQIEDDYARALALVAVGQALPARQQRNLYHQALTAVRNLGSNEAAVQALVEVEEYLPESMIQEAMTSKLAEMLAKQDELAPRADMYGEQPGLAVRAPWFDDFTVREIWAWETEWQLERLDEGLAALAQVLADRERPEEALRAALAISRVQTRAESLAGLLPRLPDTYHATAVRGALDSLTEIAGGEQWDITAEPGPAGLPGALEWGGLRTLARVCPYVPPSLGERARQVVEQFERTWEPSDVTGDRGTDSLFSYVLWPIGGLEEGVLARWPLWRLLEARAALAAGQPEPERLATLRAVLREAASAPEDPVRALAVAGLGPYVPEALQAEALTVAWGIEEEVWQTRALVGLVPNLPSHLLQEVLDAALAYQDSRARSVLLAALVPHQLEHGLVEEALTAAQAMKGGDDQLEALSALADYLAGLDRLQLGRLWLARRLESDLLQALASGRRADLLLPLRALEPAITRLGGAETAQEVCLAIRDVSRWWP